MYTPIFYSFQLLTTNLYFSVRRLLPSAACEFKLCPDQSKWCQVTCSFIPPTFTLRCQKYLVFLCEDHNDLCLIFYMFLKTCLKRKMLNVDRILDHWSKGSPEHLLRNMSVLSVIKTNIGLDLVGRYLIFKPHAPHRNPLILN